MTAGKPEQFPAAMPSGELLTLTSSTAENERVIIEAESHGTSPTMHANDYLVKR
ncbi:hypothetical protein [Amycolatopsis pithecellobii]|uniref:Uncharacterized protein n=1 Tax=Amycolatopsis pithecellobii TaxID=664692 RepID=A0A6N7Z0T2_9PSEU|nr:hypothetical protein [Amycolatopsis pithecellobii]MTD54319.1 hypothetical protein [Amycolatopsis pithecellobii]